MPYIGTVWMAMGPYGPQTNATRNPGDDGHDLHQTPDTVNIR